MKNPDSLEEPSGGPLGKLAGKAKAAVGAVTGNDELAREGRLQEAAADAEAEAARQAREAEMREEQAELKTERERNQEERERLRLDVDAEEREAAIERDRERAEREAAAEAQHQATEAEARRRDQTRQAALVDQAADGAAEAEEKRAIRLSQEARRANARAEAIDRKES